MPASEAQIRANQANAAKSTGPKTDAGKEASRANALKHGLTAVKVLPEIEAEEVERLFQAFCKEQRPSGEIGITLIHHAATMSARMMRCNIHEKASLIRRVRQAEADFVPPVGATELEIDRLREEAGHLALFDTSKEAILARKYAAAAERGFFRALKELQLHEKSQRAAEKELEDDLANPLLGSFPLADMTDAEFEKRCAQIKQSATRKSEFTIPPDELARYLGDLAVPFTIGKRP